MQLVVQRHRTVAQRVLYCRRTDPYMKPVGRHPESPTSAILRDPAARDIGPDTTAARFSRLLASMPDSLQLGLEVVGQSCTGFPLSADAGPEGLL